MLPVSPSPNFFIVGAAKSGTTSLANCLSQHPDIFTPTPDKEPAFFADHTGYQRWNEYLQEFKGARSCRAVGEKSGAYLFDTGAAERICRYNPGAKIIITLRNPVDMAYSLYMHNRREGYEPLSTFALALKMEDERASNPRFPHQSLGYYANFLYTRRATYFPQIQRYIDRFGRNQILIVRFEDLKNDAQSVCRTIYRFLGVDDTFLPDITPVNVGGSMRLQFVQDWYVRNAMLRNAIVWTTPRPIRKLVYRMNRRPSIDCALSPSERQRYMGLFNEDLQQVEREYAVKIA